jgi:hypothetical protein
MEKRRNKRYPRRFKVRFGDKVPLAHSGLTADVSIGGMFVVTALPPPLGARLGAEVMMDDGRLLRFEGMVARQTIVSPELRTIMKGGFGLRFLTYAELLGEMVPHLRDKSRFVLTLPTAEKFKSSWDKELSRGGTFLVMEKSHPPNSLLTLEIDLPFVPRHLVFQVKVMNVVTQADGKFGTALMFVDATDAHATLSAVLTA